MKQTLSTWLNTLYQRIVADRTNGYLLLGSALVFGLNLLIWELRLKTAGTEVFWKIGISPIYFLTIIYGINTFLALSAYEKEKEISYLLLGTNCLVTMLVLALELSYLLNIQP